MRNAAALLFVATLVGGCLSSPTLPQAQTTSPTGPLEFPWGISGCTFAIVSIPVDADRLAEHLPQGFSPAPTRLAAVLAAPAAAIELDAYACEAGVGLEGNLSDLDYGSYYTAVRPPAELREPGYEAYFVKWDTLVPDEARRSAFEAGGLPVHAGSVQVTAEVDGGPVLASLAFDDGSGFRFTGVIGPAEPQTQPLPFMEYTPLAMSGTLARWHARLHDAQIGEGSGTVEILPGSWVAGVVGATRAPANVIAGRWNLDEADVAFPIPWP